MTEQLKVLVLIPAYNEARRVAGVVSSVPNGMPVLVVDDGSIDSTVAEAESAGARVLRQTPNQGKGAALRVGIQRALDENFDAVITLDADGQHEPAEIERFLRVFNEGPVDLLIGARDFSRMPLVRRLANTFGRWLFSLALGVPAPDNQSGYRLISRRMMSAALESGECGFEFEVEMIVSCVRRGFTLAWVPIRTIYEREKSHIRPLLHTGRFFRLVWRTWSGVRRGHAE